jgi:hypothetical protein
MTTISPAARPPLGGKMTVLLVTWFFYGQPPATSQTLFSTMLACQTARESILKDAARLKANEENEVIARRAQGVVYAPNYPTVSAICATK